MTEPKKQEPSVLRHKGTESASKRLVAALNRQDRLTEIAIQAMQGLLAGGSDRPPRSLAGLSFEIAEAMMERIEGKEEKA